MMIEYATPSSFTKRELSADYGVPFAASVVMHLLLLFLLLGWQFKSHTKVITTPNYMNARLIKLTPQTRISEIPQISVPIPVEKPRPVIKPPSPPPRVDTDKQKQAKLREEKLKQDDERKNREEADRQAKAKAEVEKRRADEALARALADEEKFQQSVTDNQVAQSYANMIKKRVEDNWSRPPSTQKGMEILLEIQLVPSGYVVGVTVLHSSGNAAFDLSAQQAVQKVERFTEIKDMPSRLFEQQFRRFQLRFRPDDKL